MFMQKIGVAFTVLVLASALMAPGEPSPLGFSNRGKPVGQWSRAELKRIVPVETVTVWEPHEDRNVTYEGFEMAKVFAAVYGERWQEMEEVLFTCADGYQPSLPM
jgi:hypothetical protein